MHVVKITFENGVKRSHEQVDTRLVAEHMMKIFDLLLKL